jgi:hypothetical protein
MAGRTPREAVNNFLGHLQLALPCVTPSVLVVSGGYYPRAEPHAATIGEGNPVRLTGSARISLVVKHDYRVVEDSGSHGPWKVSTSGYLYSLKDHDSHDILSYHWHPTERSIVTYPHLHLGAGANVGRPELAIAHLPTRRIALEDVLRLAIREFGVRPRRSDWAEVLDSAQAAYEDWQT